MNTTTMQTRRREQLLLAAHVNEMAPAGWDLSMHLRSFHEDYRLIVHLHRSTTADGQVLADALGWERLSDTITDRDGGGQYVEHRWSSAGVEPGGAEREYRALLIVSDLVRRPGPLVGLGS